MADYDWFKYKGPTEAELEAGLWEPQGFLAVYDDYTRAKVNYYLCRRGCGTLVWSPKSHIENVCSTDMRNND